MSKNIIPFIKRHKILLAVILFSTIFSFFLMTSTLSYENGQIIVASNIYGDYLTHLPLVRSFSLGDNFPPQYQGFTGESLKYHFLFFYMAGLLEKTGLRIDQAINLLSVIGMSGMLVFIYLFAYRIAKSKLAGILAILLTIFNSSFTWFYFFKDNGFNNIIDSVSNSTKFSSVGPFDGRLISICWNLNVFTNQRHLAFGIFLMLAIIWVVYYCKFKYRYALAIFLIFALSWLHQAVLLCTLVVLFWIFLMEAKKKKELFIFGIISFLFIVPSLLFFQGSGTDGVKFLFGFLYKDTTEWVKWDIESPTLRWLIYWLFNFGITPFIAFAGWFFLETRKLNKEKLDKNIDNKSKKEVVKLKKDNLHSILLFSAITIFILANFISFGRQLFGTNHKFFNITLIFFNILAVYPISKFLLSKKDRVIKSISGVVLIFILTLGGIIDLFPVINDVKYNLPDVKQNNLSTWIIDNTDRDAKILNLTNSELQIGLTGRRVYFGWEFTSWIYGYNVVDRKNELTRVIGPNINVKELCSFLNTNDLDYIIASSIDPLFIGVPVPLNFMEKYLKKEVTSPFPYDIYSTEKSCNLRY